MIRPTSVAAAPARGNVTKNGSPIFLAMMALADAPVPIRGTCARKKSSVPVMSRKLTAKISVDEEYNGKIKID